MSETTFGFIGKLFKAKKPIQVQKPTDAAPEEKNAPVTSEWLQRENGRLGEEATAHAIGDTLFNGPPSETPFNFEALSNEGTGKSIFTLKAQQKTLPTNTIDTVEIHDVKNERLAQEKAGRKHVRVDAAAARTNVPSPNLSDVETRKQLPHP